MDLRVVYERLLAHMGEQKWWPARTRFEVVVGAILTQNTNWKNVGSAIGRLDSKGFLEPKSLNGASDADIADAIRPAGYYNQKLKKLRIFLDYFAGYGYDMDALGKKDLNEIRSELLSLWGIGPETADAILLYALDKPVFVMDAYTRRVFSRLGIVPSDISYEQLRGLFESQLPKDPALFKEYHALIDELAKRYCKTIPLCGSCPVFEICEMAKRK